MHFSLSQKDISTIFAVSNGFLGGIRTGMNFTGLIIGVAAFLMIGMFHPIVIKAEYHFGTGCWWAFLLVGLAATAASLFTAHYIWSTLLGVFAFSCFWSILEVFEQQKRVEKGWFPANPKRKTNTVSKTPKN